jgi:predicted peroxiredoxin
MSDNGDLPKKILYVQSHGADDPARAATPFYLASSAAAMDAEVAIYFTMKGPTLLKKGVPEQLEIPRAAGGGAKLRHFIDQATDLGVKLYVCQPSLDLHGYTPADLIDGVEMIGGAAFNDMALEADAVITF